MLKSGIRFCILLLICLCGVTYAASNSDSPIGHWKTIDDVTGKQKSILDIREAQDGSLNGTVVKIYPKPGKDQNETCDACEGERHNQRIVGMTVMWGLKKTGDNEWSGGEILDPNNGKTYRCALKVSGNGQELNVRGYLGIQALGRTQTWVRVR